MSINQHIETAHAAMSEHSTLMNVASLSLLGGWFVNWLPPIATALAVIWYGLCIYESDTVQAALGCNSNKSKVTRAKNKVDRNEAHIARDETRKDAHRARMEEADDEDFREDRRQRDEGRAP